MRLRRIMPKWIEASMTRKELKKYRKWMRKRGIKVPERTGGSPRSIVKLQNMEVFDDFQAFLLGGEEDDGVDTEE